MLAVYNQGVDINGVKNNRMVITYPIVIRELLGHSLTNKGGAKVGGVKRYSNTKLEIETENIFESGWKLLVYGIL